MGNKILILGRPNVGKSSLFNRLIDKKIAIVDEIPNVTRDFIEEDVTFHGQRFKIIDSSGFNIEHNELYQKINDLTEKILSEVDLVLFVVDVRVGLHPIDRDIYKKLKGKNIPFILVVNKIDDEKNKQNATDFYRLGVEEYIAVSAAHGTNIDGLVDYILKYFNNNEAIPEETGEVVSVAVVGRPNTGKSSFINKLIGKERLLVTNIPGTTRDMITLPYRFKNEKFLLIDTAGLKKKNIMTKDPIERASMFKTRMGIENSDVVIYFIDSMQGLTGRDEKIVNQIYGEGKAVVFAMNKWDLVEEKTAKKTQIYRDIISTFPSLGKPYISFISAKLGTNIYTPLDDVRKIYRTYSREIKTSLLNEIIQSAQLHCPPPNIKGKRIKIYYATQIGSKPPKFLCFVNYPNNIQESYKRFIVNTLRESLKLRWVPIEFMFKERKRENRTFGSK
jgi:GTP-binding protein